MNKITDNLPPRGRVVWCFRSYNGKNSVRLACRDTDKPYTLTHDLGANCWWRGVNDDDGFSWSDGTVEGWSEIELMPPNITLPTPANPYETEDVLIELADCIKNHKVFMVGSPVVKQALYALIVANRAEIALSATAEQEPNRGTS